jgi:Raf kinase inhibitor-like YbhB/YbcL family protein
MSVIALAGLVTACRSDGRELRDPEMPLPATTSTPPATVPAGESFITAPATTLVPSFQLLAAWPNGGGIPRRYTCDDIDVAPAVSWTSVPPDTVELAVTMTDLDAGFTHWVMYAISPTRTGLAEGEVPPGAIEAVNDFGNVGWNGPCPPPDDEPHNYLFTVHALNQQLEVADDAGSAELVSLLNQTAILQSSVSGTYARTD